MSLPRKRLSSSPLQRSIARSPFIYFGLPFILTITLASFGLSTFTATRYELRDANVQQVSKEEVMKMSKGRKKVDLREEYYRLMAANEEGGEDWENKRIERLPGQKEWGDMPPEALRR